MNNILYLLTRFILAIFFMIFGTAAMFLPWWPEMRSELVQFILEENAMIVLFGLVFFLIGLALLLYLFFSKRRRYYTIRLDTCSVEENVIKGYLEKYWQEAFPSESVSHYFTLKKNRLHIVADLPHSSEPEVRLETIKNELTEIFTKLLGYPKQVTLSISFNQNAQSL